jgi:hypothetical protein
MTDGYTDRSLTYKTIPGGYHDKHHRHNYARDFTKAHFKLSGPGRYP